MVHTVPLHKLTRVVATAFEVPLWKGLRDPLTHEEVRAALEEGRLDDPARGECDSADSSWTRQRHAERVAWFALHGWDEPITLDTGRVWPVIDGNHRLAAAVYREDPTIRVLAVHTVREPRGSR